MEITEVKDSLLIGIDLKNYPPSPTQIRIADVMEIRTERPEVTEIRTQRPTQTGTAEATEIRKAQLKPKTKSTLALGYNSFNEVYVGLLSREKSQQKIAFDLGYQFALSSSAIYSGIANPILTTNAYGLRARFGYQLPKFSSGKYYSIQLEYQDLQSNNFVYQETAHSSSYYSEFKETYHKYGLRLTNGIPISGSSSFFTYSVALFYMEVLRKNSITGFRNNKMPSNAEENFNRLSIQLSIGLRIFAF